MIFDGTKELYDNIIERFNIKEYAYFYESSPDHTLSKLWARNRL